MDGTASPGVWSGCGSCSKVQSSSAVPAPARARRSKRHSELPLIWCTSTSGSSVCRRSASFASAGSKNCKPPLRFELWGMMTASQLVPAFRHSVSIADHTPCGIPPPAVSM